MVLCYPGFKALEYLRLVVKQPLLQLSPLGSPLHLTN